ARYSLLIFDEAHHLAGRCFREAAILSVAPRRLGLTATPERADGRQGDLDWLIGPAVFRLDVRAVRGRALADYDVVRIPVALSAAEQEAYERAGERVRAFLAQRRRENPSYSWQDVCREARSDPEARQAHRAYQWRKSIEDRAAEKLRILEDIFRLHRGERILVFAGSNAMAIAVSRRFLAPALLNHSPKRERLAVLAEFAAGNLPVLVANQVLDEGIDVPEAKVAVILGGHASTRQAKQRLGRILRRAGDRRAILYEVVCADTGEVERSRQRRQSDAFDRVQHRRLQAAAEEAF
ncbi:MAG: DEAD/DEAH box helicase, partial [Planctomycetota bacterium]|nr:DEAD/DEAH box helicase [Planctomycetota bacterium]